jgi:hypothetical protein
MGKGRNTSFPAPHAGNGSKDSHTFILLMTVLQTPEKDLIHALYN